MGDLYIGLMSGTSVDGIDAALVDLSKDGPPHLRTALTHPLPSELRDALLTAGQGAGGLTVDKLGELDHRVGLAFAEATLAVLTAAGIDAESVTAIGSHGQTLHHAPDAQPPFTLQIGDPNLIAARTGITTVADFRRRDIALGGQGAPLVPAFHQALFHSTDENRCVVNIGGIANVTVLPCRGGAVTGFDTGPGNALLDLWASEHLGHAFDEGGRWAASATVHQGLLQALSRDPFFRRPPPKSTGRDYFHAGWLHAGIESLTQAPPPARVQRTLCALTAQTIADAVKRFGPGQERVLLCGGGTRNATLREDICAALAPRPVVDTDDFGIASEWIEACAFAWLAMRTLAGLPGNLPSVTGAREAAVLGGIYAGRTGDGKNER